VLVKITSRGYRLLKRAVEPEPVYVLNPYRNPVRQLANYGLVELVRGCSRGIQVVPTERGRNILNILKEWSP